MKHAVVAQHLSIDEVVRQFKINRDARVKTRWQAIMLRMRNMSTVEVAQVVGCKPDWVRKLVRRWNALGAEGLQEGRKANGRKPLLSVEQQEELRQALMKSHPDGGLWNRAKVAEWMAQKLGRTVAHARGWDYLHNLGFSSQTPRPRHRAADKAQQDAFKKNSHNYIPTLGVFVLRRPSKYGPKMKRV